MLQKEYVQENICRDICDNIDKYGRRWQSAVNCITELNSTCVNFWENDGLTAEQCDHLEDAFRKFILTIDKIFNETE